MEYTNALQRLGLSIKESQVYEVLLDKGSLSMLKLSNATGINRPVLYNLVPKMVSKGLIIETKKGKRIEYIASSPNKLKPLVDNAQKSLENIVNNLNTEFSKKQIVPRIETYYGEDGIARVYMDMITTLDKGDKSYRYSIRKDYQDDVRSWLPKEYHRVKKEKEIESMVIINEERVETQTPQLDRSVKVLKGKYDVFDVTKIIYKNKIAFVDYENKVAFVIYNERMAKLEKEIFLSLFKIL